MRNRITIRKIEYICIFLLLLLGSFLISCFGSSTLNFTLKETRVKQASEVLIDAYPHYFELPFTLIVFVDTSPCGGNLVETKWWRVWQNFMRDSECGFVFATSRVDSTDIVVAAQLDSVDAPVLVIPGFDNSLKDLKIPNGGMPLKLIVNSTGEIKSAWAPIRTSEANGTMLTKLDSLINQNMALDKPVK